MKYWLISKIFMLLGMIILSAMLFSCQEADRIVPEFRNEGISNIAPTDLSANLPTIIRKNRLVFDSYQHFIKVLHKINELTETELDEWENRIGFHSTRKFIAAIREEYEHLQSEIQLNEFLNKYSDRIYFDDGTITGIIPWRNFAALVNTDGWIYIGNSLYKFLNDRQIIIEDGAEEKIALAERSTTVQRDLGIHILYQPNQDNPKAEVGRSCSGVCNTYLEGEDKDSDGDKRLRYWWGGYHVFELLGNGNYNTHYEYYHKMESRKKSGFIWKRTWINVEFNHHVSVCFQNCNFSEQNLHFNSIHTAVADFEAVSELLLLEDQAFSCSIRHTRIDTSVDRIESPNTNDLQVIFMCD